MMKALGITSTFLLFALLACTRSEPANDASKNKPKDGVFFVNLKDGDTVKNPFEVQFGVRGMTVAKPGDAAGKKVGHHHLIIDASPIQYGKMVPMDAQHLHFMKAETAHTLNLTPGEHTLTLQFAGTDHRSYGKAMSKTIKVKVIGKQISAEQAKKPDAHAHHGAHHGKSAAQQPAKHPKGSKRVFFEAPLDGQVVPTSLSVIFGAQGVKVTPAGQSIDDPNRGHHHVVIDGKSVPKGTVVPADDRHIHYGKGQTKARLLLEPGEHTLTLQFADGAHRSFGPDLSHTIKVTAKPMHVFFKSPPNNATLSQSGVIEFGVEGATVTPAGQHVNDTTRGHHHLIIDGQPIPRNQVVPADPQHIHFGKGQTQVNVKDLNLTPGPHTLTLQFADGAHRSLGPEMSRTIKIKIKD